MLRLFRSIRFFGGIFLSWVLEQITEKKMAQDYQPLSIEKGVKERYISI